MKYLLPIIVGAAIASGISSILKKDDVTYTTKEAAELLNISEYTVRKKIREGEIIAETIPGKAGYRITKDNLNAYINRKNKTLKTTSAFNESTTNVANFSSMISFFANNSDSDFEENAINPAILQSIIEGKMLDLESLKLQLKRLELDADDSENFQKQLLSMKIAIKNLEAEIKAYETMKLLNEESEQQDAH